MPKREVATRPETGTPRPDGVFSRAGTEWNEQDLRQCIEWLLEDRQLISLLRRALLKLGRLSTQQDAEDVVHEFLGLHLESKIRRFDPTRGRFWPYIQSCLDQACSKYRSKVRRHPSSAGITTSSTDADQTAWLLTLADQSPTPEQAAETEETRQLVQGCVDTLPSKYADVIVLYHLFGMPVAAAAEHLGITVANAKVRLHRARQMLRGLMRRDWL